MKIGIIGATGRAGRAIHALAAERGHLPTAIVRSRQRADEILGAGADVVVRDALGLTAADLAPYDVVVDAFGTAPDEAHRQVELAHRLVEQAATLGPDAPRLLFILGAGSLRAGEDRHLYVEDIRKMPGSSAWVNIPVQQLAELEFLRAAEIDWVGISPSAVFEPGEATEPVLGADDLLVDEDGVSRVTTGTMAVAVLDEIEAPAHRNLRFTVRNG
ncbi:hypothetical protein GA0111570_11168 [Raineyella antarctica]|uniref:NAD(P)-binding domain-containing protein n=1 Tax=Raineyella antarctica TaxID=1577474 RepID=A0A1G6HLV3_9ACTN|nr:NAD(P)H-binding protein [Raineyella antarctica]SDB95098.1 hypothetical protein GA0111570_11168 [Raineyella antarctica]